MNSVGLNSVGFGASSASQVAANQIEKEKEIASLFRNVTNLLSDVEEISGALCDKLTAITMVTPTDPRTPEGNLVASSPMGNALSAIHSRLHMLRQKLRAQYDSLAI